jgi:hypothetical protein
VLLVTYYTTAPAERTPGALHCLNRLLAGEPVVQDSKGCPKIHKERGHALPAEGGVYTGEVVTGKVVWCSW